MQEMSMNNRALKTYVFFCSNNLDADQFAGLCRGLEGDVVKTISLPCSGKVDVPYLIKAFETGADGVAIVTCPKNGCRHFEGNVRAHKRAEAVEMLLEEIGVAVGRMAVFECESGENGAGQVLGEIRRFIDQVRNLPPSRALGGAANKQETTVA
jgi:coenzyme F420-reducing hydrogenase delta subunit